MDTNVNKRYGSEALMVSHQSAGALFRLGVIGADEMREFDDLCFASEIETERTRGFMVAEDAPEGYGGL